MKAKQDTYDSKVTAPIYLQVKSVFAAHCHVG